MTFDENGKTSQFHSNPEPNYFDAEKVVIIKDKSNAVIGIEALAIVLREKLAKKKSGDNQGIVFEKDTEKNKKGDPVNSIRKLAIHLGNEKQHSYISKFANETAMPCISLLNKIANAYSVAYVIGNFPSED